MSRLRAWGNFLADDDKLLWLGLLTRDTGIPASRRLQIRDEADALSFDLAVSLRLLRYDNEKDAANKKFWIRMLGGDVPDDDVLGSSVIGGDPFADKDTMVW